MKMTKFKNDLKGLFYEKDGFGLSLGRVSFWLVFLICCVYWIDFIFLIHTLKDLKMMDMPSSLVYILGILISYNLGKKWLGRHYKKDASIPELLSDEEKESEPKPNDQNQNTA